MVRTRFFRPLLVSAILLLAAGSFQAADSPTAPSTGPVLLQDPGLNGVAAPRLRGASRVEPDYPAEALAAGAEAKVHLMAVVRRDGTVPEVSVLDCSVPGIGFEEAAAQAVRRWRFRPATREGRPVDSYTAVEIAFEIDGSGEQFTHSFANAWRPSVAAAMNPFVAWVPDWDPSGRVLPAGYVRRSPQRAGQPEIIGEIEGQGSNARYLAYSPAQPDSTPVNSPQPLNAR